MVTQVKSGRAVVVLGQGYVGLPLAMAACDAGFEVVGIDLDPAKVGLLEKGISHVGDVPSTVLQKHLNSGAYRISTSYASAEGFDVAVITVPTPLADGRPDVSFIGQAAEELSKFVRPGSLTILESTTYPGTTEELLVPLLESHTTLRAGVDFFVGYSPERIDPGNSTWNLLNTPKVIAGVDGKSLDSVRVFYSTLGISVVPVSGTREAELTKLLENTFRHVNIALVNELAVFAEQLDVNIWEAIDAATTKPFGFMRFLPGPGVGGHCLPVDPSYLAWSIRKKAGEPFRFVELANSVNERMPHYVVQRIQRVLRGSGLEGQDVLLVGLAYKANTGDIREAPALEIASILQGQGARVIAMDPHVVEGLWPSGIKRISSFDECIPDVAVIVTNHNEIDLLGLRGLGIPILDTRNCLSGDNVEAL